MAEVSDAHRGGGAKSLLELDTPSLELRRMDRSRRSRHARRGETRGIEARNRRLNLSERLAGCEAANECSVRSCCVFEQAGFFLRRKIVAHDGIGIEQW